MDDTATIIPRNFCAEKTFLLIVVESAVNNSMRRQEIRETWGNTSVFNYPVFFQLHGHLKGMYYPPRKSRIQRYAEYLTKQDNNLLASVRVVFITGRSRDFKSLRELQVESDRHNDIIQESFIDSYNNLTLKTVMGLKNVNNRCYSTTAFVLKADDDTFVNVPNLVHILLGGTVPVIINSKRQPLKHQSRLSATSEILLGLKRLEARPLKDSSSKSYMPYYMFPNNRYPVCLSGGGYLMSMDVVQRLYVAAMQSKIVHMEDIYVTGICAKRAQIVPMHNALFAIYSSRYPCAYKQTIILQKSDGTAMHVLWEFVSNYSIKCPLHLKSDR
ncbi:beta-1,3-galactosyltransferase 1-like [Drosophila ficusphila]|uniref:beta-1,3-galactosyltransferase 1-like n=1 Tax=Drosophila ficusphila TaxID=30025 RepID=UPI0007E6A1D6|nr:beta-1,3-galactosyltransferase 1-like [Drosophila ficusphila]